MEHRPTTQIVCDRCGFVASATYHISTSPSSFARYCWVCIVKVLIGFGTVKERT